MLSLGLAASACGSGTGTGGPAGDAGGVGGSGTGIAKVQGVVRGSPLTLTTGLTFLQTQGQPVEYFSINQNPRACGGGIEYANEPVLDFLLRIPVGSVENLVPGKYPVGSSTQSGVEYVVSGNLVRNDAQCDIDLAADIAMTGGQLTIGQIDANNITGELAFDFEDGGSLSGSFSLPRCTPGSGGATCVTP